MDTTFLPTETVLCAAKDAENAIPSEGAKIAEKDGTLLPGSAKLVTLDALLVLIRGDASSANLGTT